MAREASGRFSFALSVDERQTALGTGDVVGHANHTLNLAADWSSGTADGSVDRVWSGAATASTTPTDVDVVGSLTSIIGAGTVGFADVVLVAIRNTGSTVLRVGGDANALAMFGATNDLMLVQPGGMIAAYHGPAGLAAVAGTGDILQLDTASGTTTYQIVIVGRSA